MGKHRISRKATSRALAFMLGSGLIVAHAATAAVATAEPVEFAETTVEPVAEPATARLAETQLIATELIIVTTINPLRLIAEEVVGELGRVETLVPPQQSPHHYSLTPSARLSLDEADIVLWIGSGFEVYLAGFLTGLAEHAELVAVADLPGIRLANRGDDVAALDYHLWLDTDNAKLIAAMISDKLGRLRPTQREIFARNLQRFQADLDALEQEVEQLLPAADELNYAVYHNSIQYFERQFGLRHAMSLLSNPEVQPGMRELMQTQARLKERQPACVLLDPESNPALLATLLDGAEPQLLTIDLLGFALEDSHENYPRLIYNLAEQLSHCRNRGNK
ncbi:MAG: zinc ABC transporter substrate-binding protein [Pseudohongiellaceae bacterium]